MVTVNLWAEQPDYSVDGLHVIYAAWGREEIPSARACRFSTTVRGEGLVSIAHNMGTKDVMIHVIDTATGEQIIGPPMSTISPNTVDLFFPAGSFGRTFAVHVIA